jgi:hypothetical protein
MTYIGIVVCIGGLLLLTFYVYNLGENNSERKQLQEALDDVKESVKVKQKLNDPSYIDKLRNKYRG